MADTSPLADPGSGKADPTVADATSSVLRMGLGPLAEKMGIELVTASAERTVGIMPVAGNTQPHGLLNGGASVVLGETLGSLAATLHAGPGRAAVGLDVNATHHRAAREGTLTGVATAVHLGGRVASYEWVVTDEPGRRICSGRLTCAVVDLPD